jgi:hypothetical protein
LSDVSTVSAPAIVRVTIAVASGAPAESLTSTVEASDAVERRQASPAKYRKRDVSL